MSVTKKQLYGRIAVASASILFTAMLAIGFWLHWIAGLCVVAFIAHVFHKAARELYDKESK